MKAKSEAAVASKSASVFSGNVFLKSTSTSKTEFLQRRAKHRQNKHFTQRK